MKNEICPDWIWNQAKIIYANFLTKYSSEELKEKTIKFAEFMCNNSSIKHPEFIEDFIKKCEEMAK